MSTKTLFAFTLLVAFFHISFAQTLVPGELVIQLKKGADSEQFFDQIHQDRALISTLQEYKTVSTNLRLHVLKYEPNRTDIDQLITSFSQHPDVTIAGQNFKFELRNKTPNDLLFNQQWGLDPIEVSAVWECTTGGTTILGDTIVVANLESCDIYHEDLKDNIWINHGEIPDDGIDNDGNGYTDDYHGYNITDSNDNHIVSAIDSHGTQTAGIIGAKGDNDIGISGINWNIKIMVVSNNLNFDEIIESYEYVLKQRQLYNQTNGEKGAFVVATNASFGANGFPTTNIFFPPWCELYNLLGKEGVLSAGATTNNNVNIDIDGDMPTSCSSDFLIAVTNVDQSNKLEAGFSETMVDLGAPGSGTRSTNPFDEYGTFGGTSAATPHVSGGIGLLYSLPCETFAQLALDNPEEAARKMKQYILNGAFASSISELEGKTVTGGLLNLKNSMNNMQDDCGSPTGPIDFISVSPNPVRTLLSVEYQTPDNTKYDLKVYDAIGRLVAKDSVEPVKFEEKKFTIDVSGWASGVYNLTIENVSNIKSVRFVVQ